MGCVASRFEREEEVVSICRERKQQLKLAVEQRYALADAHFKYCKSLYGVSAALNLFVKCHSSPPSPYLIDFQQQTNSPVKEKENVVVSNPLFLKQTPTEPTKESIITCNSCTSTSYESSVCSDPEECDEKDPIFKEKEQVCNHFYMDMSNSNENGNEMVFGWEFFNPFETRQEVINVYSKISEEDLRVVREQEGIPELEEEGEEEEEELESEKIEEKEKVNGVVDQNGNGNGSGNVVVESGNVCNELEQEKGLSVIDTPVRGRELLEALKDIEDHFIRAYESGKYVSKMLECNRVHLQSNLEEIKGEIFYSFL